MTYNSGSVVDVSARRCGQGVEPVYCPCSRAKQICGYSEASFSRLDLHLQGICCRPKIVLAREWHEAKRFDTRAQLFFRPPTIFRSVSLPGRRDFWADVKLAVSVEIIAQNFQLAMDLFAETILVEAKGCQGSNKLLLRRVVIDFPLRQVQQFMFILSVDTSPLNWRCCRPVHERIPYRIAVKMLLASKTNNKN